MGGGGELGGEGGPGGGGGGGYYEADPADIPLCPEFARRGECRAGDDCALIHGDLCDGCGLHALHPYSAEAAALHASACAAHAARRGKLARDRAIECGICLERCAPRAFFVRWAN